MTSHGRLEGRTILVTGAASGIGAAYVDACAREGARLVVMDIDRSGLDLTIENLKRSSVAVAAFEVDISDEAAVDAAFASIKESEMTLDGVFLNAGINAGESLRSNDGELGNFDSATWHRLMDVNLNGFFYTLQRSAEMLKARRSGSIVVTSSTSGIRPEPLVSYAYIAAKSAVTAVSKQAALELVKYGVRINVIAPGPIRTNIGRNRLPDERRNQAWIDSIPMRRRGEPRELEALALLLISDDSSFMTGGVFTIDGGASVLTQVRSDEL